MSSKSNAKESTGTKPNRICSMCDAEASEKFYPFCSRKCEKLDLHRWLSDTYAIPASEEDLLDEEDLVENGETREAVANESVFKPRI